MSKKTTIQTIGQSDKVGLYSILFDGKEENEFREFLHKFKDNARLNKDFQAIVRAIDRIIMERWRDILGRKGKWQTG